MINVNSTQTKQLELLERNKFHTKTRQNDMKIKIYDVIGTVNNVWYIV